MRGLIQFERPVNDLELNKPRRLSVLRHVCVFHGPQDRSALHIVKDYSRLTQINWDVAALQLHIAK
jgi:hypothetical protein